MTTIETKVKHDHPSIIKMDIYQGYITVKENGRYLFSKFSGINRLNKEDAKQDAINLKNDAILSNSGVTFK
jgi:hypothetical protein